MKASEPVSRANEAIENGRSERANELSVRGKAKCHVKRDSRWEMGERISLKSTKGPREQSNLHKNKKIKKIRIKNKNKNKIFLNAITGRSAIGGLVIPRIDARPRA